MEYIDFTKIETAEAAFAALNTNEVEVKEYFLRIERVMHYIIETAPLQKDWSERYWCSGINPFYKQLDLSQHRTLGLALVEYYGHPSCLATPFGSITFGHGGRDIPGWFDKIVERLELRPLWGDAMQKHEGTPKHSDVRSVDNEWGAFGPVWSIGKDVDGNAFPECDFNPSYVGIPGMHHHNALQYEVSKAIWERCMTEGFRAAKVRLDKVLAEI